MNLTKKLPVIAGILILGTFGLYQESYSVPLSCGLTNPNLFVSAENISTTNTFGGPMVTEVIICDSDISDTTQAKSEPDVTVNGQILRMVQAVDGNWYGYFADRNMAQIADQTVEDAGTDGTGLDFGTFCDNNSTGIQGSGGLLFEAADSAGIAVSGDVINGVQGITTIEGNGAADCTTVTANTVGTPNNNVVREAKNINTNLANPGQINIDENAWPFIQLYPLNPTDNVIVQYNKGGIAQTVTLTFDDTSQFANLILDQTTYAPGSNVKASIFDTQLNIDPTDEDSWTWATISTGSALFYDLFDENGITTGDGIQTSLQNIIPSLPSLMFINNGKLIVEKNFAGTDVLQFEDNDLQNLDPSIDGGTSGGTILAVDQPVTFTENSSNSGTFVNFDVANNANIDVKCDAPGGFTGIIEYNALPQPILISGVSCIDSLINYVIDLVNNGSLNNGQGNALIIKLQNAQTQFDNGNINVGCNLLSSFITQVQDLVNDGDLMLSEGQDLINQANSIIDEFC